MGFAECFQENNSILMEGALGERLKREFGLMVDDNVALASMIYNQKGADALKIIWEQYISIAKRYHLPFLAMTPTRRANQERVKKTGYVSSIIDDNVKFLKDIQQNSGIEMYVGGLMGCKGDAYSGKEGLSIVEAIEFHKWQANLFAESKVDFLYAGIMPALPEAVGMANVMSDIELPYIISFTIQKDGKLLDGTTISDAIINIDNSVKNTPICYMTNCVHPKTVYEALNQSFNSNESVRKRFLGIQANTSQLSYEELDNSKELKGSEANEFAQDMINLRKINAIKIFGGCCGTDHNHMEQIARRL